jgi:RNA polymerase primary sigma factor
VRAAAPKAGAKPAPKTGTDDEPELDGELELDGAPDVADLEVELDPALDADLELEAGAEAEADTADEADTAEEADDADDEDDEVDSGPVVRTTITRSTAAPQKSGDFVWDEEESEALRQARKDAELTASADSVRAYLKQIGKVALLNAEEEVELAKRIEAGLYAAERLRRAIEAGEKVSPQLRRDLRWIVRDGERAKNHLLEANLALVVSLAKRYTGRGMAFLDLIQEGNLGLIRAVEKFDYTKGYKFSTVRRRGGSARPSPARWPTRPAPSASRCTWSRSSTSSAASSASCSRTWAASPPRRSWPRRWTSPRRRCWRSSSTPGSPSRWTRPSATRATASSATSSRTPRRSWRSTRCRSRCCRTSCSRCWQTLSEREAGVVRLRFGLTDGQPRTLDEIGQVYGVTRERIRQIESKTMSKLRHPSRSQVLRDYLD